MELKNDEDKEEEVKQYPLGGENGEVDPFLGYVMVVEYTKEATI